MSARAFTRATRMAATFLAKLNGSEAAATAFGIDPRTVRSWQETVPVPDDAWTAIRDVLLARGAEMAATGKTTGLAAVLTGAGISDRNVRYGQLIARREARREAEVEPEPSNPIKEAIDGLDVARQRLLRDNLFLELRRREQLQPADWPDRETSDQLWLAMIAEIAALTDAEVETELARVRAELDASDAERDQRPDPGSEPLDEPTHAAASFNLPQRDFEPRGAVTPPPERIPAVLDVGGRGARDEPWYDMDTGERRPPRW